MAIRNLIGDITENNRIVGLNIIQEMPYGWEFNGCQIIEPHTKSDSIIFYEEEPAPDGGTLRRKYVVPRSACMIIARNEYVAKEEQDE